MADRLGALATPAAATTIEIEGTIRIAGTRRFLRFCARERFNLTTTSACWSARIGPCGWLRMRSHPDDGLDRPPSRLLGLFDSAAAQASDGAVCRYLAQLPFAPDAIILNRAIAWRAPGSRTLIASAGRVSVELRLDGEGLIESVSRPEPLRQSHAVGQRRWKIRFSAPRRCEGRLAPTHAQAEWITGGTDEPFWRARVMCWRVEPRQMEL